MAFAASKMVIPTQADASGWRGELSLGFIYQSGRTVLKQRRTSGPLTVQRPFYPEDDVCHVYILHPPGGIVGGDQLKTSINVAEKAKALLTTPGAGKYYRSAGAVATFQQELSVQAHASLEWFPQENIIFNGARTKISTHVNLHAQASYIGWEIICLGRPASNEVFQQGSCSFNYEIWREHKPLLIERFNLSGGDPVLHARWGMQSNPVIATMVITSIDKYQLREIRDKLRTGSDDLTGTTLIDGLLVCRYLGQSVERAKNYFINIWELTREHVIGRATCPPRIWNT